MYSCRSDSVISAPFCSWWLASSSVCVCFLFIYFILFWLYGHWNFCGNSLRLGWRFISQRFMIASSRYPGSSPTCNHYIWFSGWVFWATQVMWMLMLNLCDGHHVVSNSQRMVYFHSSPRATAYRGSSSYCALAVTPPLQFSFTEAVDFRRTLWKGLTLPS